MKSVITTLNRKLREAGAVRSVAVFHPAEDDFSVDDGIVVSIDGVEVLCLQLGRGYVAVNRYIYENGELDAIEHLHHSTRLPAAIGALVRAAVELEG